MGKPVPLLGSPYDTRDPIFAARRCVNLYPEKNGDDAIFPFCHWPTPGLRFLAQFPNGNPARCFYRATNDDLYGVAGRDIYFIAKDFSFTYLGSIQDKVTPVFMADNGLCIVIVDGTAAGYVVDMTSRKFSGINDPAFYGADRVDYVDTYFVFNRPATNQWYISLSEATYTMFTTAAAFDPLDIAAKAGGPDNVSTIIVKQREVWLIGNLTSEPWYNAGAADFAFAATSGAFIDHGLAARYSLARQDVSLFWLAQDKEGSAIVVRTQSYQLKRISTHAIEAQLRRYVSLSDAIGFCLQQNGHAFYILTFPTADKTWSYDLAADMWHELEWTDANGNPHRHRANCHAFAYGQNIVGDWQNGKIYALDPAVHTDDGAPIRRLATFRHLQDGGNQVSFTRFILDCRVGSDESGGVLGNPSITLRVSHDRGASFGNGIITTLGAQGAFDTQVDWYQLGMGRDTVFEVSTAAPVSMAINGAYVETERHVA